LSSVQFEPYFDSNEDVHDESKVYKSRAEVMESYLLFIKFEKQNNPNKDGPDSPSDESDPLFEETESYEKLVSVKRVYIPEDIMEISSKEKNIVENDFGVRFYENPYKRVILKHLSNKQAVHFYTLNK